MNGGESLHIERREGYHLAVDPSGPIWGAVNEDGAWALRQLRAGRTVDETAYRYARRAGLGLGQARHLVGRFAEEAVALARPQPRPAYAGRSSYLEPHRLREVWLHLTDRCNLACRHCLVASGPRGEEGLPTEAWRRVILEATALGAEIFYLTGGEPLLRADLMELLELITREVGATAVLMTNGALLERELAGRLARLPEGRLFLQVSLDGSSPERNDALRSPGSFAGAVRGLRAAVAAGLQTTVAAVVMRANLDDLGALAELVRGLGVAQLHLMWQHARERGARFRRPALRELIPAVSQLARRAADIGLVVDNVENARRVANGEPFVKYDLSNACWDSLAVHHDGKVYPSACLVGIASELAGSVQERPLKEIWLDSPVCAAHRARSVVNSEGLGGDPLLFLHGGGDSEQAFFASAGNGHAGVDPYLPLHRALLRMAMDETVARRRTLVAAAPGPVVYHVMGEDGYGCPIESGARNGGEHTVDFARSNCVLIQDVVAKARAEIRRYYGEAAREPKAEICSPVALEARYLAHIPEEVMARSYGCGSPVLQAEPGPGERVVDLGSGAGLECFIAARLVGEQGLVVGIDMTPEMLAFANRARGQVAAALGYDNARFQQALLEALPLRSGSVDVVVSNCVLNLSPEKLRVLAEVKRALRPGGRVVISDVVSQEPLPAKLRLNPRLRGECIAGALTEAKLLRFLERVGFVGVEVLARAPWRVVEGVRFESVTVRAWRPAEEESISYTYPGPFRAVTLETGEELVRGVPATIAAGLLPIVANGHGGSAAAPAVEEGAGRRDCLVCGAPLEYLAEEEELRCHSCGRPRRANARCARGHFVCDHCHTGDRLEFIRAFCQESRETDPVALFAAMRRARLFPLHGPEHHALVPAAFLTAYRNRWGEPSWARVEAAIARGGALPGGTCAYWGACAAALGAGVAYAAILGATPLAAEARGRAQRAVARILVELGRSDAPRCCRRESYLALQLACRFAGEYLPHGLTTDAAGECDQTHLNRECIGPACPFHPTSRR